MSDRLDQFGPDATVSLITFTDPDNLPTYQERNRLRLQLLIDPDRSAYRAFGLGRGSVHRVWGLRAARRYLEILRRQGPSGLHRPVEDTLQLGGDFVISPAGTLAWGFWGRGPDDRPDIDQLVEAVRAVTT